jgi:hypothetical protein
VAAVPALVHVAADGGGHQQVASSATPTRTPTASPEPTTTLLELVAVTTQPTVTFPYSPTFVPDGLPGPAVLRTEVDAIHHSRQLQEDHYLRVEIHSSKPSPPDALGKAKPQSIQVRGRTGTILVGRGSAAMIFLYWQEKPDQWLSVTSQQVSKADVVTYANGLRERTLTGTEAFHFTLLPADMVIHESLHYSMTFSVGDQAGEPVLGVLVSKQSQMPADCTPVRVGRHNGCFKTEEGSTSVVVDLGHRTTFQVGGPLSNEDLVRLAAGTTVDLNSI